MERKELKTLVNKVLDGNKECHVDIDVWHPTIKELKYLLSLGHDNIDSNNSRDDCTIYGIEFDKYGPDTAPAFKITIFCNTDEGKFMYKYTKQGKEVINSEN